MAERGRPTDYTEEMKAKAESYLDQCNDKFDTDTHKLTVNLPSVASLARYLGISRSTVYRWADLHNEFRDILEDILAEQEKRLLEMGLSHAYASSIVKLALGKHGYKDEGRTEHEAGATLADLMRDAHEESEEEET